jgi:hypothetical protein
MRRYVFLQVLVVSLILGSQIPTAEAVLSLTPQGIGDGFTLTTFVSGFNAQYGPLAQGIAPNGNVITGSALGLKIFVFNDVDGQTLASAVASPSYTAQTGNPNFAMTTAGGQVYGAQLQGNAIYEKFNSDGTFSPIPNLQALGLFNNLGMWGNPVNGHIIAASNKGLVDIDPIAGSFRVINASIFPDGVTVSPDGNTAFVALGQTVQSFDIATGAHIHTFNTGHSPDGTGVISGGLFNGDIVVNNNDGTVGLLDPTKPDGDPSQFVIIASGGTRGDFVSPDTSNGTLFLSQNEQVARLSCGPGCSIGSTPPPTGVPEPSTMLLLASGLGGMILWRRRSFCKQM